MHPRYDDITSRIAEKPSWWQEGGVPRYGTFHPGRSASIYAREVALVEIACQACDARFKVVFDAGQIEQYQGEGLADRIRAGTLHYGDPPNAGCCPAGPTMNSEPVAVLEYWSRCHQEYVDGGGVITDFAKYDAWRREALLEGPFGDEV